MNPVSYRASGKLLQTRGMGLPNGVYGSRLVEITPGEDSLRFSGAPRYPLIKKYGLSVAQIPVLAPEGVKINNKSQLVEKALESMETALKWKKVGNFSQRYLGTQTLLSNGIWASGVNVELSRDCTLCAERSGLVSAQCKTLDQTSLDKLEANPIEDNGKTYIENWNDGLQVKTMVLGSSVMGTVPGICSDCEGWMTSTRYYSPETQLVWLEKDKVTDSLSLRIQPLSQRLPFWGKNLPSTSELPVESLPVEVSADARQAMAKNGVNEEQLRSLLLNAKQRVESDPQALFTGKNLASSMMFSSGQTETASRVDLTKRWFVPGDLAAFALGVQAKPAPGQTIFQKVLAGLRHPLTTLKNLVKTLCQSVLSWLNPVQPSSESGPNRIQAIAYYGNDGDVPPMVTTGYFAQPTRGGMDTLLAVIEKDTIQIRTIRDYRPLTYISDFQQPQLK